MTYRLRLVEDWKEFWKWSSVRLLALSGVAETGLHFFKDLPWQVTQYINQDVLSWLATGSFVLAFLGRVTQVEKKDDGNNNQ